jgi:PAS domain S-box-containing protein
VPSRGCEIIWAARTGKSHYQAGALLAVPALRKDGSRISVEFTVVPFRDTSEQVVGIGALIRDVTARFEETKGLRKQVADLRKRLGEVAV